MRISWSHACTANAHFSLTLWLFAGSKFRSFACYSVSLIVCASPKITQTHNISQMQIRIHIFQMDSTEIELLFALFSNQIIWQDNSWLIGSAIRATSSRFDVFVVVVVSLRTQSKSIRIDQIGYSSLPSFFLSLCDLFVRVDCWKRVKQINR